MALSGVFSSWVIEERNSEEWFFEDSLLPSWLDIFFEFALFFSGSKNFSFFVSRKTFEKFT
jgi:hypothetical protein